MVFPGKGLARDEGRVVFIPGALPGERVRAETIRHSKNFSVARLTEVIEPSPKRIRPECPLALGADAPGGGPTPHCPGCCYQHVDYGEEVRLKQAQFANLLEHMAHVDPSGCLPPMPSPLYAGYRNRIALHSATQGDGPVLGYFAEDNKTIIDVPRCALAAPAINELLTTLRGDAGFVSGLKPGATVTLRCSKTDGALHWLGRKGAGGRPLTEQTPFGSLTVPRGSFFQVNPGVAHQVSQRVKELLEETGSHTVVDLYCGAGFFAPAAHAAGVRKVVGIDADRAAVLAARGNARSLGMEGASFLTRDAREGLNKVLRGVDPGSTTLIVDPPRRGLEKEVIELTATAGVAHVLYVSCAPDTLARDVARFVQKGYRWAHSQLADMFPRTPYFESITRLSAGVERVEGK